MKTKLISFGIVTLLVIGIGLSINQTKDTARTILTPETASDSSTDSESPRAGSSGDGAQDGSLDENPPTSLDRDQEGLLGGIQYAISAVRIGDKTFSVELAMTREQQALGLGERDNLPANLGMLFVFKPADIAKFWMKGMRFNLDMVWIADGKVVEITRNAPAPKLDTKTESLPVYSANTEVDYVLELNAGAANTLKVGDSVEVIDSSQV